MRKILLILLLVSCNPVKQVLRDKSKFDQVAAEVVRQGYCANDTLVIVKSDTLVKVDSLIEVYSDTTIINDTAYVTLWETKNYTRTFIVHDTLRSVVVDNARIKLLQADLSNANAKVIEWEDKANKRKIWILILVIIIFIYLRLKK